MKSKVNAKEIKAGIKTLSKRNIAEVLDANETSHFIFFPPEISNIYFFNLRQKLDVKKLNVHSNVH